MNATLQGNVVCCHGSYMVSDFAPLGGSRPDCALSACAATFFSEEQLPVEAILPKDVLDVTLALLCAPLIVRSASDLWRREAYFDCEVVSARLRTTNTDTLVQLRNISSRGLTLFVQLKGALSDLPDALKRWTAIKKIDLRRTELKDVGDFFLSEYMNLTSVELPDSVSTVSNGLLERCTKLKYIDLRRTQLQ